jgi:formylglycine-generating enzyme required for sulfatase activity
LLTAVFIPGGCVEELDDDSAGADDASDMPDDEMVRVAAGAFWMGCSDDEGVVCPGDELPFHEVTLAAFEIDRTEVTVQAYDECVAEGACSRQTDRDAFDEVCEQTTAGRQPVNCVTWSQADAFCEWAGKQLPTEAQWEKAARGDDGRIYPWGDEAPTCERVVSSAECADGVEPVGSRPDGASPYGALDMAGNLFEWTADWYSDSYYSASPASDPMGPEVGERHTIRSAGPNYTAAGLRISVRGVDWEQRKTDAASSQIGFRCARED